MLLSWLAAALLAAVAERLAALRAETGRLKTALARRGGDTAMLYTTLVHALPLLVERVVQNAPQLANLLISNPFGPPPASPLPKKKSAPRAAAASCRTAASKTASRPTPRGAKA